jgi:hypothetical protein
MNAPLNFLELKFARLRANLSSLIKPPNSRLGIVFKVSVSEANLAGEWAPAGFARRARGSRDPLVY